ncbi:uncharacterized protein BP01DRAFT_340064 [Aspergillus saccharolyticus JOP 1030-1]|uniref:JmjC domain-containing protein n=1 Tax=Aspergillus saccharolyticus JOP 1030-1 TaxID=1450539 RepID=A0A318ZGH2_9EURO|nr:hypothetical protein BP01DRAFT_340064 [Aspergillus saccharolyticus JOP 1030-1]PYH45464.1 hypothetical protein BP01DRAFT_340064 [Aspergillus saccharolyticus JOP 1030-1]
METVSAHSLLSSGEPFVPFSEYTVHDLDNLSDDQTLEWIDRKLQEGKPFVIRGFDTDSRWNTSILNNATLGALSASKAIPVRNCSTGRDVKLRLQDILYQNEPDFRNALPSLYAKDLQCPKDWIRALDSVLPPALRHLGTLDLFRVLPKDIVPEVLMAYVGTQSSFSGFHRCFSGTAALNLLISSQRSGRGSICFGTDRHAQSHYDAFMEEMGKSPHTDWVNVTITPLSRAKFPIYVTDQFPGDLVVFPPATAHQVWNVNPLVTKVVWNIMHSSSLTYFFDYVQPVYQHLCHADTGRVPLIPVHALDSGSCRPEENALLLTLFQNMIEDEEIENESDVQVKLVDTQGAVVECNFCGLTIWNRHLHCEQCGDFDLCLKCFVSGRSCKHLSSYVWAELLPRDYCNNVITSTRNKLSGAQHTSNRAQTNQKSLGTLAAVAAHARKQSTERLCHLCRDSHSVWKGMTCSRCDAFFCFRGLHRHFDVDLIPYLRDTDAWICPKCSQVCNCRCCHFVEPYQSKDKPVRARVKPVDQRGRITGFVDNVFDQRRGKRAAQNLSPQTVNTPQSSKRLRIHVTENTSQSSPSNDDSRASIDIQRGEPARQAKALTPVRDSQADQTELASVRNQVTKGKLRISDLVEDRRLDERRQLPRACLDPHSSSITSFSPENQTPLSSSSGDISISALEKKLNSLRQYAEELLDLSLVDSHAKLLEKVAEMQKQVEEQKRRKAEALFSNLHRDFPDLADIAREEARRRGF